MERSFMENESCSHVSTCALETNTPIVRRYLELAAKRVELCLVGALRTESKFLTVHNSGLLSS